MRQFHWVALEKWFKLMRVKLANKSTIKDTVEGQWVFGGIEEDSQNSFIIAVDKQDETTLMPLIKYWIKPRMKIVSDCWEAYSKIKENGYKHEEVSHSKDMLTKMVFIRTKWRDIGIK